MGVIYTQSPRLFGGGNGTIETFEIGMSIDADVWPVVTRLSDGTSNQPYVHCGGRVRTQVGGSGSKRLYFALRKLRDYMRADMEACGFFGEQGDLFGARPHTPKRYIERHVDDGHGYLGIEILPSGTVRICMRPLGKGEEVYSLNSEVEIHLPPDTPYQRSYAYMRTLWWEILRDNAKLKGFGGYHA